MDILVKIAQGHPPSVENAIGPEETTRRLALNSRKIRAVEEETPKEKGKGKAT
jgi:hypothetical protein